ncbi:MAG: NFACT RNA binding domain-containing protein [Acidobacteriota bacterium]
MASKGRGYRTIEHEGFTILVGKGAADNDRLSLVIAEPRDFWLHIAGGTPGSHVVVRNPDDLAALPRSVEERAAALAAWHSKGRNGRGKTEVHICRARDVSKPCGYPAGRVNLRRFDRLKVYAERAYPAGEEEPT